MNREIDTMNNAECRHERAVDLFDGKAEVVHPYCPVCGGHCYLGTWRTASEWAVFISKLDVPAEEIAV
jgi:hypothetical protein